MMSILLDPVVPAISAAMPAGTGRGRILVVDDQPSVREFIKAALHSGGYDDLIFLAGGAGVLGMALSDRPRLIIMDVMMPGGNGMRALRALRTCRVTASIPVIITSGFNVPLAEDKVAGRPDEVLSKPFTVEQLLEVVGRLIKAG
ncbi:MAG: response regulator [Verrucomicrobiales bacterium]